MARATVYYQFGSKAGVLEALCDALAEQGRLSELAQAFTASDPDDALRIFVSVFTRFWGVDRLVMRRLRALAVLDPDVAAVIDARDERRRHGLQVLLGRRTDVPDPKHALRTAHMLTSFETFDALLRPRQRPADAVPILVDLVTTAITATSAGFTGVQLVGINYAPTTTFGSTYYTASLDTFKTADVYMTTR